MRIFLYLCLFLSAACAESESAGLSFNAFKHQHESLVVLPGIVNHHQGFQLEVIEPIKHDPQESSTEIRRESTKDQAHMISMATSVFSVITSLMLLAIR
jgi:hypothetical protein